MIDLVSADIQDFQKRQFVNLTIKCQYIDRYVPYDRGGGASVRLLEIPENCWHEC